MDSSEWMSDRKDLKQCRTTLSRWCHEPQLEYRDAVAMKPGWEKRQPAALAKRDSELESIETSGALGIKVF